MYSYGLSLSDPLDVRFNKSKKTGMNQKDVPGSTIGHVALAAKTGVQSLHVGVNDFSTPPGAPSAELETVRNTSIIGLSSLRIFTMLDKVSAGLVPTSSLRCHARTLPSTGSITSNITNDRRAWQSPSCTGACDDTGLQLSDSGSSILVSLPCCH